MPKENHSVTSGEERPKKPTQGKKGAKSKSSLKRSRTSEVDENQKALPSKVANGIKNKKLVEISKGNKKLDGKHEQQDSDSSDDAPEEMANEVAKSMLREAQILKETTAESLNKRKKEKKSKNTKNTDKHAEQYDSTSKQSLPTPLSLDILSKAENKGASKTMIVSNHENNISSNISPEELEQKNKKIKKAKTQKAFGDIRVKVLKEKNPWDLPPIKIDKGASDFLQTALYSSRAPSRQRKQIGLALDPCIIGPAPKFVREQV